MKCSKGMIFFGAIAFMVSGCAELGVRSSVPEKAKSSMRSFAVVSALGTSFHGTFEGTTVLTNKRYDVDVAEWGIDAEVVRAVSQILKAGQGKEVAVITAPVAARPVTEAIAAAKEASADTLVLIAPSGYDNQPGFVGGFGYYKKSLMGLEANCIYSLFVVEIYDVSSGKRLAWEWGFPAMRGIPCYGKELNIPWREQFSDYSAAEKAALREAITQSVRTNVATGIKRLGL